MNSARGICTLLFVWLVLAIALGASGWMSGVRPPLPQVLVVALTVSSVAALFRVPAFRLWADTVPVKALVALHLTRFVAGAYFLVLAGRGLLAPAFAIPAGWGDMAVAVSALGLLLAVSPQNGRRIYAAWNVLGLLDILFVVVNAARVAMSAPETMRPLLQLPLSLLPTFLVPVIIASHVLLIRRLRS